jgi:hypothetical protein
MTDFSQVVNEESAQTEGSTGGGFVKEIAVAGVALFRLRDILELGTNMGEYAGKPKQKKPVKLTFELVHPRHAIKKRLETDKEGEPATGDFIRYQEISVNLNKSNSDKSAYMKLFNRMNFDGAVATPKGKVPSFVNFAGKGFLGEIHHNKSADGKTTYVNLDKDGVYTIGAPRVPKTDELGAPTGEYNNVPVPEMTSAQRVFLWETGVSDEVYTQMWDSIAIVGEKADGTPYSNWIQEAILRTEDDGKYKLANIALPGSRAERLFGSSVDEKGLDADLAAGLTEPTAVVVDIVAPVVEEAPTATEDPLAALGL